MWWNFVGRDHEDIVAAREQWMAADAVRHGPRLSRRPAAGPPMPTTRLKPRGRHR